MDDLLRIIDADGVIVTKITTTATAQQTIIQGYAKIRTHWGNAPGTGGHILPDNMMPAVATTGFAVTLARCVTLTDAEDGYRRLFKIMRARQAILEANNNSHSGTVDPVDCTNLYNQLVAERAGQSLIAIDRACVSRRSPYTWPPSALDQTEAEARFTQVGDDRSVRSSSSPPPPLRRDLSAAASAKARKSAADTSLLPHRARGNPRLLALAASKRKATVAEDSGTDDDADDLDHDNDQDNHGGDDDGDEHVSDPDHCGEHAAERDPEGSAEEFSGVNGLVQEVDTNTLALLDALEHKTMRLGTPSGQDDDANATSVGHVPGGLLSTVRPTLQD